MENNADGSDDDTSVGSNGLTLRIPPQIHQQMMGQAASASASWVN